MPLTLNETPATVRPRPARVEGSSPAAAPSVGFAAAGNRAFAGLVASRQAIQRHEGPITNQEAEGQAGESNEVAQAPQVGEAAGGAGTGTTGGGTSTLTGAARRQAIEDTMRASNTGVWALGVVTRWSIPVDYEYTGQGSFHSSGSIFVNRSLGIGAAAMTMMHEAQHANTFKSGNAANIDTLTKVEFVRRKIADEAEAVVREIEGFAVTSRLGVDMTGVSMSDGLKRRYTDAFAAKGAELRAANPALTTEQVNDQCRTWCRDNTVTSWFHDGTFVTSTGNITYSEHYGRQWDAAHPAPAPAH